MDHVKTLSEPFEPTPEELRDIDEAIAAVRRGEIASKEEVEAVFAKYRRK